MIPGHIKDELNALSQAQQMKFHELVGWAQNSGFQGSKLPVDYGHILDMVKRMSSEPIEPVAPIIEEDPQFNFRDYIKNPQGE
jgi:hypothetical protein